MFAPAKAVGLLFIALSLFSASANAGCDAPQSQDETIQCAIVALKTADADLNQAYDAAVSAMKKLDSELPPELKGGEQAMRNSQRDWIKFRDSSCVLYGFDARGGKIESTLVTNCRTRMTRSRVKELNGLVANIFQ